MSPIHAVRSAALRHIISKTISAYFYIDREEHPNLELDGQHGWKSLDRESFVGLLRDLAAFLTGPIFDRDVLRLRESVSPRCRQYVFQTEMLRSNGRTV